MASYTNMTCLIQLNSHCWDCNNNIKASLYRMYGVTSVTVDSYNTVKVTGNVEPRSVMSVVQSYDIHARLLSAKPTYSGYYQNGYSYPDQYCYGSQPMYYNKLTMAVTNVNINQAATLCDSKWVDCMFIK